MRTARPAGYGLRKRDVDDAPPERRLLQGLERGVAEVEGAVQIDVDDRAPPVGAEFLERTVKVACCVIDQDVDGAESVHRLGNNLLSSGIVAHIGRDGENLRAGRRQDTTGSLQLVGIA